MTYIEPIATHGIMVVYRRKSYERGVPRYCVIRDTDGRVLEDFTRKRDALRWAKQNRSG